MVGDKQDFYTKNFLSPQNTGVIPYDKYWYNVYFHEYLEYLYVIIIKLTFIKTKVQQKNSGAESAFRYSVRNIAI